MSSWTGLACLFLTTGLILFSISLDGCEATEFRVGGKDQSSWSVPTSPNGLNDWAEKERFKIGDVLVFKYDSKTDSVLKVDEEDYKKCNKSKPLMVYTDGSTKIKLDKAGPFFFISGADGHCEKGEKLEVKVLSHKHSSGSVVVPSPAPIPKSSPLVLTPPVLTPADAPKSSGGSNTRVVGITGMVMATLVVVSMV